MAGCENENNEINEINNVVNEMSRKPQEEIQNEESIFENIKPYFLGEGNRIYIYDLKTWNLVFTYVSEDYDIIGVSEILENGYFLAFARNYDAWDLAWQEWWANNDDWPERDEDGKMIDFSLPDVDENQLISILIFDESFNEVGRFILDDNHQAHPPLNTEFWKYENDKLFLYGGRVDLNVLTSRTLTYYRFNVGTGEIDEVFQLYGDIRLLGYAGDNHFLGFGDYFYFGEEGHGGGGSQQFRETSFGLINIETGEKNFFTVENFGHGRKDRVDSLLLISEMSGPNLEQTNRVIVFNVETESYDVIQLLPNDSHIARLSLSGDYIVTVNLAENLFRKYDMEGNIIFETPIEMSFETERSETEWGIIFDELLPIHDIHIFVIDENTYSIHYTPWEGERQVEFIHMNQ